MLSHDIPYLPRTGSADPYWRGPGHGFTARQELVLQIACPWSRGPFLSKGDLGFSTGGDLSEGDLWPDLFLTLPTGWMPRVACRSRHPSGRFWREMDLKGSTASPLRIATPSMPAQTIFSRRSASAPKRLLYSLPSTMPSRSRFTAPARSRKMSVMAA